MRESTPEQKKPLLQQQEQEPFRALSLVYKRNYYVPGIKPLGLLAFPFLVFKDVIADGWENLVGRERILRSLEKSKSSVGYFSKDKAAQLLAAIKADQRPADNSSKKLVLIVIGDDAKPKLDTPPRDVESTDTLTTGYYYFTEQQAQLLFAKGISVRRKKPLRGRKRKKAGRPKFDFIIDDLDPNFAEPEVEPSDKKSALHQSDEEEDEEQDEIKRFATLDGRTPDSDDARLQHEDFTTKVIANIRKQKEITSHRSYFTSRHVPLGLTKIFFGVTIGLPLAIVATALAAVVWAGYGVMDLFRYGANCHYPSLNEDAIEDRAKFSPRQALVASILLAGIFGLTPALLAQFNVIASVNLMGALPVLSEITMAAQIGIYTAIGALALGLVMLATNKIVAARDKRLSAGPIDDNLESFAEMEESGESSELDCASRVTRTRRQDPDFSVELSKDGRTITASYDSTRAQPEGGTHPQSKPAPSHPSSSGSRLGSRRGSTDGGS